MGKETNPQKSATVQARNESKYSFLTRGTVSYVPENQSRGSPSIVMQEGAVPSDTHQPVLQPVHGDYYLPPGGLPVISGALGRNVYGVLAAETPDVEVPAIDPGERILSHPLSNARVKFNKDGTLSIRGDPEVTIGNGDDSATISLNEDGSISINGGTEGAITDVTADTTTDADGHVTDVTLDITREDTILI